MNKQVVFVLLLTIALTASEGSGSVTAQDASVFVDYPAPPTEISVLAAQSDAVVIVTITDRENWGHPDLRYPLTKYSADLVNVIKPHVRLAAAGQEQFIEIAGEQRTSRGIVRTREPAVLKKGDQAIVFLRWNNAVDHFQLHSGAHGVYFIEGAEVHAAVPDTELARQWHNKPRAEFVRNLKAAAARNPR